MPLILALDQGTTSSRAILFDEQGFVCSAAQREIRQIFPQPGWVEHDPEEIWETQRAVAAEAIESAGVRAADLAAIGISNQRETTVLWDRVTGEPLCNAIVWQDRRTAPACERLVAKGKAPEIGRKTGLVVDPYFSATKIAWMLEHVAGAREAANAGRLAAGTVDSWLIWKLTGGALHATDVTNASRTMLYDIHAGDWDEDLLRLFDIPRELLPQVRSSSERYADASIDELRGVPVSGIAGDQQAALFGQACFDSGAAKCTYGTGCFALMNTGRDAPVSKERLVTTVAWKLGGTTSYALEGSIFVGGAVVQWLRDGLGLVRSAAEIERLAATVEDNGDVYFVPAFTGLGAPHWDPDARGLLVGLSRGTEAGHVARAALEGIAFQVADVLDAMARDAGRPVAELRVDGGAAANDLLMQFQADLLGVSILRPRVTETTALGAACLAGLGVGLWSGPEEIDALASVERRFEPAMDRGRVAELRGRWNDALSRARGWAVTGY